MNAARRQWQEAQEQNNAAEDEIEKLNNAKDALEQELVQARAHGRGGASEVAKLKEELAECQKHCVHLDARKLTKEQCAQRGLTRLDLNTCVREAVIAASK